MSRSPLRFLCFAVLAVGVALGGVWFGVGLAGRQKRAASSDATAATADDVAELRAELAALKRASANTQRFVAAQVARTGAAPTPAPAPVTARIRATPEEAREFRLKMRSSLETAYNADGADSAWSGAAVAGMRRSIAAELPGTQVTAAECARTMCRLRLVFTDGEAADRDLEHLSDLEPFASEIQYLPEPDAQPPATTIYVARAGASLPLMP
jgi:hypothetical protein